MRNFTIFGLLGIVYVFIEVVFGAITAMSPRLIGQSSVWMFIVGGLSGYLLGLLNDKGATNLKYPLPILLGGLIITTLELISGIILNIWCKFNIWSYSDCKFNFLGQIELGHCICWLLLTPLAFWLDDVICHYMFGEERPAPLIDYYLNNQTK